MPRLYVALAALCASGCQQATVALSRYPRAETRAEALAGQRASVVLEEQYGGVVPDPAAEARIAAVAARLVGDARSTQGYHFRILGSPRVNAFSLPGGFIYVTQGLYVHLSDDGFLAAVVAHELGHLSHGDSFKPPCKTGDEALEREGIADRDAVRYLAMAGYDPGVLERLLRGIEDAQPPGWASRRIDNLRCRTVGQTSPAHAR